MRTVAMALTTCVLAPFGLIGCAPTELAQKPAFTMGLPIDDAHADITQSLGITVLQPAATDRAVRNQEFDCRVRLTVPQGSRLPGTLIVLIRDRSSDVGSVALLPEKLDGDTYVLRGHGVFPSKPKSYELIVQAAYLVERRQRSPSATNRDVPQYQTVYVNSKPQTIVVTR